MIYFDNAATQKPCEAAIKIFEKAQREDFFNPNALYLHAQKIEGQIGRVRTEILSSLSLNAFHNLIFCSGATEANNTAILQAKKFKNKKILISAGEHPSVFDTAKSLFDSHDTIDLKPNGQVCIESLTKKLTHEVCMVCVCLVNGETGAISDIEKISKIVKDFDNEILILVDCVQGLNKVDVKLPSIVDFYTFSAHKIAGLKGVGALAYRQKINIKPLMIGGGQENGLRSGTQNVGAILAFGEVIKQQTDKNYVKKLNTYLREKLQKIDRAVIISDKNISSPYILSFCLKGIRSETVVRLLAEKDIIVSNGSACSSKSKTNRTLSAMGVSKELIEGAIRISFCESNTTQEIDILISELGRILS